MHRLQSSSAWLDAARERLGCNAFEGWSASVLVELTRLMRKFRDALITAGD